MANVVRPFGVPSRSQRAKPVQEIDKSKKGRQDGESSHDHDRSRSQNRSTNNVSASGGPEVEGFSNILNLLRCDDGRPSPCLLIAVRLWAGS